MPVVLKGSLFFSVFKNEKKNQNVKNTSKICWFVILYISHWNKGDEESCHSKQSLLATSITSPQTLLEVQNFRLRSRLGETDSAFSGDLWVILEHFRKAGIG